MNVIEVTIDGPITLIANHINVFVEIVIDNKFNLNSS